MPILTVLPKQLQEQKVAVFVFIRPYSVTGTTMGAEFYVHHMMLKFFLHSLIDS